MSSKGALWTARKKVTGQGAESMERLGRHASWSLSLHHCMQVYRRAGTVCEVRGVKGKGRNFREIFFDSFDSN
jgi:hypothetical protein